MTSVECTSMEQREIFVTGAWSGVKRQRKMAKTDVSAERQNILLW